jgi:beta-lactam-binding protein with PASTA domain
VTDSDYASDSAELGANEEAASDKRKRRIALVVSIALLLLLILFLLQFCARVPNTIGMGARRARIVLHNSGFSADATTVPAPYRQVGRVLTQSPRAGLFYFTWWPVRIAVGSSLGYTLIDVTEVSVEESSGVADLPMGVSTEVMPYDPEEMAPLYFPPGFYELLMPDVQNMRKSQAAAALGSLGLKVKWSAGPSTTGIASNRVYYQKPSPGVSIKPGQTVSIWVSEGPFSVISGPYEGYPFTPMELYPSPEVVPDK